MKNDLFDLKKNLIVRYLKTPLYFSYSTRQRKVIYLMVSLLIGMVAFAGSTFHPGTIITYIIVGISYFVAFGIAVVFITEVRTIWLLRQKSENTNLTIGEVWILGLIIFLLGFLFLGVIQLLLRKLQIPELAYYFEPSNGFMPFSLNFLLMMFPTWAVDVFLVNHVVLKKVKPIKRSLPVFEFDTVELTSGKNAVSLNPENISHISIDQHYANIFIQTIEGLEEVQIKSSLKTILDRLPEDIFCRIHHSHAVNLKYVEKVIGQGNKAYVKLKDSDITLPVSRRKLTDVKFQLQSFTELKLIQPIN